MKRAPLERKARIERWGLALTAGTVFQGSCDPEVRLLVLSGLNELAVALVDALFIAIQARDQMVSGAQMLSETLQTMLA